MFQPTQHSDSGREENAARGAGLQGGITDLMDNLKLNDKGTRGMGRFPSSEADTEGMTLSTLQAQGESEADNTRPKSSRKIDRKQKSGRGMISKSRHPTVSGMLTGSPSVTVSGITKSQKRRCKQCSNLALWNTVTKHLNEREARQTYKHAVQHHSHDIAGLDSSSCPLCVAGIPLASTSPIKGSHDGDKYTNYLHAALSNIEPEIREGEHTAHGTPSHRCLKGVRLYGGPSTQDTIQTTSTCHHCEYSLDAFVTYGEQQGWVIADHRGITCFHYLCAAQVLPAWGITASEWQTLGTELAKRGLYMYMVVQPSTWP